jgi:hypothetical protein
MVELKKLAKSGRSKPTEDDMPDPVRDAAKEAFDREVEEELRRDQIEKIWAHYSKHILAAAGLVVLGVGGWKFIESRQIAAANAAGARFEAAAGLAEAKKVAEAQQAFAALTKDSPPGYRMLASLRVAASELNGGRTAEALAAYEAAAATPGADPLLIDFARLQIASLKIDTADWTEMQNRLTPLSGDKSPWRYSARELMGMAALKAGKSDEAKTTFEQLIADRRVPPSISERARVAMDSIVAVELAKAGPAAQPKAAEPAPKKQ